MRIGIVGAMNAEIEKFIPMLGLKKDENAKKEVYVGTCYGKKVIVVRSGIGKVNSGAMTQYLIDAYEPDLIINSGCAGSLVSSIKIMDAVLSSYVTYHDFSPVRIMQCSVPNGGKVYADGKLIDIAIEAMKTLNMENYHIAPICSGDAFVTNAEMRDKINIATGAKVVDMESASIGHIAALNHVPFISVRTISDFSDGEEDFEELAAYKSSNLVMKMIELL